MLLISSIALLLLHSGVFYAQNNPGIKVSGIVTDDDNEPLPYVTVVSYFANARTNPLKMAVTCKSGGFTLTIPVDKDICLKFTYMGMKKVSVNVKADSSYVEIGKVQMEKAPNELQEIVVRPLIEEYDDQIIYNITADPLQKSSSMLDIFSRTPQIITGFMGNINFGDGKKFIVLRNGKKDALFNLQNMKLQNLLAKLPVTQVKREFTDKEAYTTTISNKTYEDENVYDDGTIVRTCEKRGKSDS
jgi:hypothetical protein